MSSPECPHDCPPESSEGYDPYLALLTFTDGSYLECAYSECAHDQGLIVFKKVNGDALVVTARNLKTVAQTRI